MSKPLVWLRKAQSDLLNSVDPSASPTSQILFRVVSSSTFLYSFKMASVGSREISGKPSFTIIRASLGGFGRLKSASILSNAKLLTPLYEPNLFVLYDLGLTTGKRSDTV